MNISLLEQARIQAQVLVPLVKTLQAELGEDKANAIVRKALGPMYRAFGEQWWKSRDSENLGQNMASAFEMYAADRALSYEIQEQSHDRFSLNVTGCRFAEFFHEIGAPELGFLLVCGSDFPMTEGLPDIELERTQTIMQGASHCDFRYRRKVTD